MIYVNVSILMISMSFTLVHHNEYSCLSFFLTAVLLNLRYLLYLCPLHQVRLALCSLSSEVRVRLSPSVTQVPHRWHWCG